MNKTRITAVTATAGVALAALTLGGCAKFTEPFRDAPRSDVTNSQPADVIEMPDGFNNLATKCDHGNRIYVSYHGNGGYGFGFTVPRDPTCR